MWCFIAFGVMIGYTAVAGIAALNSTFGEPNPTIPKSLYFSPVAFHTAGIMCSFKEIIMCRDVR